jgi:hypothetical protein
MKELILDHLLEYGIITDVVAYNIYRCRRLAHYIYLLRKEGYEIESEDVPFVHSITGRKSRYVRYRLIEV